MGKMSLVCNVSTLRMKDEEELKARAQRHSSQVSHLVLLQRTRLVPKIYMAAPSCQTTPVRRDSMSPSTCYTHGVHTFTMVIYMDIIKMKGIVAVVFVFSKA